MNEAHSQSNRAAQRHHNLSRRRFLRGLGACVALPAFESLIRSGSAMAASTMPTAASSATGAPVRMAFVYFPNGAIQPNWWPTGEGKDLQLARTMKPLESVRDSIQILAGLDHQNATPGPDGAGDHARASGSFLTGVRVKKTAGADIHCGVSIDQVVANQLGHLTRFPSLELTCDSVRKSGNCDSGYSCAYQHNLSWQSPTTPVAPEPNPRLVFERLFGAGLPGQRASSLQMRKQQQRSILDFVREDAATLDSDLGSRDRAKLDEYLTSVREIEKRIESAEQFGKTPDPSRPTPDGIPAGFKNHIQLMYEMMILAFQTDSTRIATFLLEHEGGNRAFPEIGIPEGHHYLSHHRNQKDMIDKVAEIDLFYMQEFARFIEKMKAAKDVDGQSLLANSMIVYGSGHADANRHSHTNLPVLLAGGGGGSLKPGRYVKFDGQPMTNLFLSMADRMGATGLQRFGDSTGRADGIS
jgi:hypothetical protein